MNNVSMACAYSCLLIGIMSKATLPCKKLSLKSASRGDVKEEELAQVAADMATFMEKENLFLQIASDEATESKLAELMLKNNHPRQQYFMGTTHCDDAIESFFG